MLSPAGEAAQYPSGCGSQPQDILAGTSSAQLCCWRHRLQPAGQGWPAVRLQAVQFSAGGCKHTRLQAHASCRPGVLPQPTAAASRSSQDVAGQALDGTRAGSSMGGRAWWVLDWTASETVFGSAS